jgi:hypothetical protein
VHTAASLTTSDAIVSQATLAAHIEAAEGVVENDDKSAGIPMAKQPTPDKLLIQSSVKSAYEAPAAPSTAQPTAEATIATAPVPRPMLIGILKKQKSEILEIVETIHDNIDQQRADLLVCIPELRTAMCDLMEEHLNDVKMLATKLGLRHSLLAHFMHHDHLEDKVNGALGHINFMVMDTQEDWTAYRDIGTGLHAPQSSGTPHSPGPDGSNSHAASNSSLFHVANQLSDASTICGDHGYDGRHDTDEEMANQSADDSVRPDEILVPQESPATTGSQEVQVQPGCQDWKEYSDVSRGIQDCVVPPHSPGPHAPGSNHSTQPMAMHAAPRMTPGLQSKMDNTSANNKLVDLKNLVATY